MAQIDLQHRRIDVKLVYWGPARGGKTTTLRALHGACEPRDRGDLSSVDTEDERTYYFDYAPLDLPRYRGFAIRVNAFTVPGQEAYVETRRRILRGASAVVFVADASPGAQAASLGSWRQLDDALRAMEGPAAGPRPIVLAANKQDVVGAADAAAVRRILEAAVPARPLAGAVPTSALRGAGVVRCFREVVVAALDRALGPAAGGADEEERRRFLDALTGRFGGAEDGVPLSQAPERRAARVPISSLDPDAGGLEAAIEAHRWLAARDLDLRNLRRESALARLLVDLGHLCLSAADADPLARSVLATLVMGLDAVTGWAGLPEGDHGERVLDAMGPAIDGGAVADVVRLLQVGAPEGRAVPLGAGASEGLPGAAAGGSGLFATFGAGAGRRGWLLLLGPAGRPLPADAEAALGTAAAFLGLALARLQALRALRAAHQAVEERVAERTRDLLVGKTAAEERLRAALHERDEARAALASAGPGPAAPPPPAPTEPPPPRPVTPRLAPPPAGPLRGPVPPPVAPVPTPPARLASLGAVARSAAEAWRESAPPAADARVVVRGDPFVACPAADLETWVFRVLSLVGAGRAVALRLEADLGPRGPRLLVTADEPLPAACAPAMAEIARAVEGCGGRFEATSPGRRAHVQITLPGEPAAAARPAALDPV